MLLMVIWLLFGLFFFFFANFTPPHKKQCHPEAEEGALGSMGLLGRPQPLLLLFLPSSQSEASSGSKGEVSSYTGAAACSLRVVCSAAGREAGRIRTPGPRRQTLRAEISGDSVAALTSPVRTRVGSRWQGPLQNTRQPSSPLVKKTTSRAGPSPLPGTGAVCVARTQIKDTPAGSWTHSASRQSLAARSLLPACQQLSPAFPGSWEALWAVPLVQPIHPSAVQLLRVGCC